MKTFKSAGKIIISRFILNLSPIRKVVNNMGKKAVLFAFCFIILILALSVSVIADNELKKNINVLVCSFYTVSDSISQDQLVRFYQNGISPAEDIQDLIISRDSSSFLLKKWDKPASQHVVITTDQAIKIINSKKGTCGIIPFDKLEPDLKLISIDNNSPLDKNYSIDKDPLALEANEGTFDNFSSESIASVLMTGTTALTRLTAYKMQVNGSIYPGLKIKPYFDNSDLRHISNEVSFWNLCPDAYATSSTMQFCSKTYFLSLFDYLGINVIELTGNHLRDYDWKPLTETFELLDRKGFQFYGAGRTNKEAEKVLKFDINGNKIAFLGCNAAGPDFDYIDEPLPGTLRCDYKALADKVRLLKNDGYLPIVTLQYFETYSRIPADHQIINFQNLFDAGAVAVLGSQAHYSQIMKTEPNGFIHYGLGNMFFDQMDIPVVGTRQEFLDRLVFYRGKLIQVQLYTAMLEDYSQPRPMTLDERKSFLTEIFKAAEKSKIIN